MSLRPLASVALLGLLLASPSMAQSVAPVASAASDVPEGFAFAPDGTTLVHVASGLRFPAEFKGFTRLKERTNDPCGEYVTITYDHPLNEGKDRLIVNMAVVHIDKMSAKDHYVIMRQRAMSHFSAASIVSEGPAIIPTNRHLDAYRGIFSGYRDNMPWHFSLTTANYGYWSGRLTAAYPEHDAVEAENYMNVLLSEIRAQKPRPPKR